MKLRRILAPTDFSRFSGFALEWAANLAEALQSELILLHVIPEEEGQIMEEVFGEDAAVRIPKGIRQNVVEERRKKFQEQFDIVLPRHLKKTIQVEEVLRIGIPFLEIIKIAKEKDVDLVVMGTHGRTGLAHVLIGSVAEKVVHHAHCPVLTIKHPQYQFIAP
jgi:nucleotide-binding universal stress UspA family protein